jgi:hypothetical protein
MCHRLCIRHSILQAKTMTLTLFDLLILALFTWRAAFLVAREDAPFRLMRRFRARYALGMRDESGHYCLKCVSIWAALVAYLLWFVPALQGLQPVVWIGAVSGAALMLASFTGAAHQ